MIGKVLVRKMSTRRLDSLLILFVTAVATSLSFGGLSFRDITLTAGTAGPTKKEDFGGYGVMFAHVDKDGLPDLYITMIFNKPMPDLFFRNPGDNRFASKGMLRGIADFDGGSHGACWADFDRDCDYDLINGTIWDNPESV